MIEDFLISKLTLLENNPRKIKREQMEKLCNSITEDPAFLERRPVLVNRVGDSYNVYAGNQRVRAAKRLKWKKIPCIVDVNLSPDVMKSRVIKDNKSSGEWDFDILANEYDIEDLVEWGFEPKDFDLDGSMNELNPEEDEEEKEKCPICGK